MPSTNGHGSQRAILYARVSTKEQAESGYSLAQQLEALREYAAGEGYEVLEEIKDPGQSGASLVRPGMDQVRDLVATGGVSVVLAQDRDRFAREPAYMYLLKQEFAEHGAKIHALNDQGDGSPEGELTDGILDQVAKYQRASMAEKSRRGKLQKAREGKVVAGHTPNYGFRFNATRDGYLVDKEKMRIVRRIFRMVGEEGVTTHGVTKVFESEGVKSPAGSRYWSKRIVKRIILDDVYKPHGFEEIAPWVAPEVAARLDPGELYGVWWFNRRRTSMTQVSEVGPDGRTYHKRRRVSLKDRSEWIAVPVPDSGIPREVVDAARSVVAQHRAPSKLSGRFWELSGALMRCGACGRAMEAVDRYYRRKSGEKGVICYYRCREANRHKDTCQNNKSVRSDRAHPAVWELVSGLLKDPEQLRADLDRMIELERNGTRGDPEREAKAWLEKLAELDEQRSRAQNLAIEGLLDHDELRAKLAALEEARETARRELEALDRRQETIEELERDRDALLDSLVTVAPEALDSLAPEERHRMYKMLRLIVVAQPDGTLEVNGVLSGQKLGTSELTRM